MTELPTQDPIQILYHADDSPNWEIRLDKNGTLHLPEGMTNEEAHLLIVIFAFRGINLADSGEWARQVIDRWAPEILEDEE